MKIKLGQLVDSIGQPQPDGSVSEGALTRFQRIDLGIKSAMRLKGILKTADEYLSQFSELRLELYKKHGTPEADGKNFTLQTPEQRAAFVVEFKELLETDIELPGERFKLSDFFSHARISTADLFTLEWLVDSGEASSTGTARPALRLVSQQDETSEEILDIPDLQPEKVARSAA